MFAWFYNLFLFFSLWTNQTSSVFNRFFYLHLLSEISCRYLFLLVQEKHEDCREKKPTYFVDGRSKQEVQEVCSSAAKVNKNITTFNLLIKVLRWENCWLSRFSNFTWKKIVYLRREVNISTGSIVNERYLKTCILLLYVGIGS